MSLNVISSFSKEKLIAQTDIKLTNPTNIDLFHMRKDEIRRHLMNNTILNTLQLTHPINVVYVTRYQELFNHIIPIHTCQPKKTPALRPIRFAACPKN